MLERVMILLAAVAVLMACCAVVQRIDGNPIPTFFGYSAAFVLSGSMEPSIPTGSIVLIQRDAPFSVGDIVTYRRSDGITVTHRVQRIRSETVQTRGDANRSPDPEILHQDVLGRVVLHFHAAWLLLPLAACVALSCTKKYKKS